MGLKQSGSYEMQQHRLTCVCSRKKGPAVGTVGVKKEEELGPGNCLPNCDGAAAADVTPSEAPACWHQFCQTDNGRQTVRQTGVCFDTKLVKLPYISLVTAVNDGYKVVICYMISHPKMHSFAITPEPNECFLPIKDHFVV